MTDMRLPAPRRVVTAIDAGGRAYIAEDGPNPAEIGAFDGMAIGGIVQLFGLEAFSLLLGRSPGGITGAPEGLLLGGAVGLGAWLAGRQRSASMPRRLAIAGPVGAAGGGLVPLLGGR